MRNSATVTDSSSLTRAASSRRNEPRSLTRSGGRARARKTSSCGLPPTATSSAGVRRLPLKSGANNESAASGRRPPCARSRAASSPSRCPSSSASFSAGNASCPGRSWRRTDSSDGGTWYLGWYRYVGLAPETEAARRETRRIKGGLATSPPRVVPCRTTSVVRELRHQLHDPRRRERVLDPSERSRVRDVHGSGLDG